MSHQSLNGYDAWKLNAPTDIYEPDPLPIHECKECGADPKHCEALYTTHEGSGKHTWTETSYYCHICHKIFKASDEPDWDKMRGGVDYDR